VNIQISSKLKYVSSHFRQHGIGIVHPYCDNGKATSSLTGHRPDKFGDIFHKLQTEIEHSKILLHFTNCTPVYTASHPAILGLFSNTVLRTTHTY